MNKQQQDFLTHLGSILFQVPAAKRQALSDEVQSLLASVGLDLNDHKYLLGERFKKFIPQLKAAPASAKRKMWFSLSTGQWPDYAWETTFAMGYTSMNELVGFIKRTPKMIENYFKDPLRQDGHLTCFNIVHERRTFLLRVHRDSLDVPTDGDRTIAEALKLAPAKHGY